MNRREAIRRSLAVVGLPALCCTTEEVPSESLSFQGESLFVDLSKAPVLRKPGGAAKVIDVDRNVNLIVVHPEKNHFAALDRSCTHGGAQVTYNRHHKTVLCTSWGHSEFALDGTVLGGSAKKALRVYEVRRQGSRIEIVLGAQS